MKLYGGARHFLDLEKAIAEWTEKNPILAPTRPVARESYTYELFMPDKPKIPLLEWSSRFGDAVHNLRAALDLLAFELCHIEGASPEKPKQVSFPVLDDSGKWDKQTKALSSIPLSFLQRIANVQPWHTEDPATHLLTLITALDNLDKHRSTVGMMTMPGGLAAVKLYPMPEDAADDMWRNPWFAVSFAGETGLNEVPWPKLWQVEAIPMVFFDGRMTLMVPLQRWLYQETDRLFKYITSGSWSEAGAFAEPEWLLMPPQA